MKKALERGGKRKEAYFWSTWQSGRRTGSSFDAAGLSETYWNFSFRFCSRIKIKRMRGRSRWCIATSVGESQMASTLFFFSSSKQTYIMHVGLRNRAKHSHQSLECALDVGDSLYDRSDKKTPEVAQWVFPHLPAQVQTMAGFSPSQSPSDVSLEAEWQEDRDIYRFVVSSCGPARCAALWRCKIYYSSW